MNFLGIDIGTTSIKAAAFDENGRMLGKYSEEYTLEASEGGAYVEFPAERYFEMVERAVSALAEYRCAALAVDTQGETLIVTDEAGAPLRKAIVWLDNRAVEEADILREKFGAEAAYRVTGQAEITATWPAAKLLWLRRHEPETFAKIRRVFMLGDYINYRLTGRFVADRTLQSSTLYFDVNTGGWWEDMLRYLQLDVSCLPQLTESGEKIGEYRGMTVGAGALDQIAACVGTGVIGGHGIVSEMTGTVLAVCAETDRLPAYDASRPVPCHWSVGGRYCLILWSPTAGMTLKWFRDTFCPGESFADLDKLAAPVPAGCEGLSMSPHLCGRTIPYSDPAARGSFTGIGLHHTKGHFVRAILEAVAVMLRECVDELTELTGSRPCELRATGGGALSPLWCRIKAEITGLPLSTLDCPESACLGSAILASVAHGAYPDVPSASLRTVALKHTYQA